MQDHVNDNRLWIAQAKTGDREAFSLLMEGYQSRLHGQALAFVKDSDEAQELVQETMIEAWKSFPRFDGSCRLFTWLYVILLRRRRRRHAQNSRTLPLATLAQQAWAHRAAPEGPDAETQASEAALLRSMVETLPEGHRNVVRLRFYAQADEAEIAASLGISQGTVKSRMHHALEKLRSMTEKVPLFRLVWVS
jgi:RNA polymerase sigma-70 factor, ECF subfamily